MSYNYAASKKFACSVLSVCSTSEIATVFYYTPLIIHEIQIENEREK